MLSLSHLDSRYLPGCDEMSVFFVYREGWILIVLAASDIFDLITHYFLIQTVKLDNETSSFV